MPATAPGPRTLVQTPIIGAELDIKVIAGRGLIAKDGGLMSKKSSDPFVRIGGSNTSKRQWAVGKTKVVFKSLDPTWDEDVKFHFDHVQAKGLTSAKTLTLVFSVFDHDAMSFVENKAHLADQPGLQAADWPRMAEA